MLQAALRREIQPKAQYTPPTPMQLNCRVELCRRCVVDFSGLRSTVLVFKFLNCECFQWRHHDQAGTFLAVGYGVRGDRTNS